MKPAPFRYILARTLDGALAAKAEHGDEARFLAGGQSLVPTMNFRLAQPAVLIDINPIAELCGVRNGGSIRIGAMTRYRILEADSLIAARQPILCEALPHIAHPQIRNRGTLGGNLAHADPASEMPAIMLALGARMRLQSKVGERWVAADDFFVSAMETALRPDEMLTEIDIPDSPPNTGACFMEVARRQGDFAQAGVAALVTLGADGTCSRVRLAFCGVAERPSHADAAAQSLIGAEGSADGFKQAADLAMTALDPPGSNHASAGYQRHIAGVLARRALTTAHARASGGARREH